MLNWSADSNFLKQSEVLFWSRLTSSLCDFDCAFVSFFNYHFMLFHLLFCPHLHQRFQFRSKSFLRALVCGFLFISYMWLLSLNCDVCWSLITHFFRLIGIGSVAFDEFSFLSAEKHTNLCLFCKSEPLPIFGRTDQTPVSWVKRFSLLFCLSSVVCQFLVWCRYSSSLFYLFIGDGWQWR